MEGLQRVGPARQAAEVDVAAGGAGDGRRGVAEADLRMIMMMTLMINSDDSDLAHGLHVIVQLAADQGSLGEQNLAGENVSRGHHVPAHPGLVHYLGKFSVLVATELSR